MIRNNLAILMSERGIKNGELSLRTGISKNTISATAKGDGKMIQLETIDKICQALEVTPNDFFSYTPYNVSFKSILNKCEYTFDINDFYEFTGITFDDIEFDLLLTIERSNRKISDCFVTIEKQGVASPLGIDMVIAPVDENNFNEFTEQFEKIPLIFRLDIIDKIEDDIQKQLQEFVIDTDKSSLDYNELDLKTNTQILLHGFSTF